MTVESGEPSAAPQAAPHIVDQLIEERAVRLRRSSLWPIVRSAFYPVLGYRRAVEVADAIAGLSGPDAMNWAQDFLSMRVDLDGLSHVPEHGACVILANHPGGIADGIALWQGLRARRPDIAFFANLDAIRVCPGLSDLIIPVEWRAGARSREKTRETLRQAVTAFRQDRCIVVFPAGQMSQWDWRARRLKEAEWMPTAVGLAKKFNAPILPLGVDQRMSWMFYGLGQVNEELKHMTVFHELLAKKRAQYRLAFGPPLDPNADLPREEDAATAAMRARSEHLAGWVPRSPAREGAEIRPADE